MMDHEKWLVPFADKQGRPWGSGTAMADRSAAGFTPWDTGCTVTPLIGGYRAMDEMMISLNKACGQDEQALAAGHVYLADWRFSPLRDIGAADDTRFAIEALLMLMSAGIRVRALFWLPTTLQGIAASLNAHIAEHFWAADIIARANKIFTKEDARLDGAQLAHAQRGIVGLDARTAEIIPPSGSHHQKMMVIRVGSVNVAFCGGVDLTYTRRDAPADNETPATVQFMGGDHLSGRDLPRPVVNENTWPGLSFDSPPAYAEAVKMSCGSIETPPTDLPVEIYGQGQQIWHDQHLKLEGPIVQTLEAQFRERWTDAGLAYGLDTPGSSNSKSHFNTGEVIFSTAKAFEQVPNMSAGATIYPLVEAAPVAATDGVSAVQMWRTVPYRPSRERFVSPLFGDGEFTVMNGLARAVQAAENLIWIFDQYFWSLPMARLLNQQLKSKPNLGLILLLPPHADGSVGGVVSTWQHEARYQALTQLTAGLSDAQLARVAVYDLWKNTVGAPRGIYCHAKVQMFDDQLLCCGSANLNRRSLTCDTELVCAVHDPALVRKHQADLCTLLLPGLGVAPNWTESRWGPVFVTSFVEAARDPKACLIREIWADPADRPRTIPAVPDAPADGVHIDSKPSGFGFGFPLIADPSSICHEGDKDLQTWVTAVESPHSRSIRRVPVPIGPPPPYGI